MSSSETADNVLVIVLDTVRAKSTSICGRDITPTIADLSEDGSTFERAITTAPWTYPSHASMFTGEYPTVHGAIQMNRKFPADHPTLAERLSDRGFRTALFSASGFLTETYGLTRGFDTASFVRSKTDRLFQKGLDPVEFLRENEGGWTYKALLEACLRGSIPRNIANVFYYKGLQFWRRHKYDSENPYHRWDDEVGRQTRTYISERVADSEDFFVFVNLIEAHAPWPFERDLVREIGVDPEEIAPPERWEQVASSSGDKWQFASGEIDFDETDRKLLTHLYESWVRRVDSVAGSIIQTLDDLGVREDTLIVLTSDHGEIIAQEGDLGHTTSVSSDVARVPLVIDGPGVESSETSEVVSLKDIFGTILERTGITTDAASVLAEGSRGEALIETRGPHERLDTDKEEIAPHLWGTKRALYTDDGWVERHYYRDKVRGNEDLIDRLDALVDTLERSRSTTELEDIKPSESQVSDRLEDLGYLD